MTERTLLTALVPTFSFAPAAAQDLFYVSRLEGAVTLDGMSDERAWQDVAPVRLVMNMPSYGLEPSEPTEILIAYDETYLYVAARCHSEPGGVLVTSFKRDIFTGASDYIGITLTGDARSRIAGHNESVYTCAAGRLQLTVSGCLMRCTCSASRLIFPDDSQSTTSVTDSPKLGHPARIERDILNVQTAH